MKRHCVNWGGGLINLIGELIQYAKKISHLTFVKNPVPCQ